MALKKFGSASSEAKPKLNRFGSKKSPKARPTGSRKSDGSISTAIEPKYLPKSVKAGDRMKVTWTAGGQHQTFVGEVVEMRDGDLGHYFKLEDNNGVWFSYAAYLCDSMKKVIR